MKECKLVNEKLNERNIIYIDKLEVISENEVSIIMIWYDKYGELGVFYNGKDRKE